MLKVLGSFLVFGGAGAVQLMQMKKWRRELAVLFDLQNALERMENEIRINRTPLPALLQKLGRQKENRRFFRDVAAAVRDGGAAGEAWRRGCTALPLELPERELLAAFGDKLSGDETEICGAAKLTESGLAAAYAEKARMRTDRERRSGALCFSAAAFTVILLI